MMNIKKYYNIGKEILYPINRSITGRGTLKTLKIIKKELKELKIKKIKSGTKVYDWVIPSEWNVTEAYVTDKSNNKIIDFKKNNLHLVGYSIPVDKILNKKELFKNLYSQPNQPDAIPYVTSYYKKKWGFCISENKKKKFKKIYNSSDKFRVFINSKFNKNGNLVYGEYLIKGTSKKEILVSTYICHPSMANNELSGPILSMSLIDYFKNSSKQFYSMRFLFIPETIGSIAYISKNFNHLKKNVIGGYNLTCVGDNRMHSCMLTKYGNMPSDDALLEAYRKLKIKPKIHSFLFRGSDERQYNAPGIDLNISSIYRTKFGCFPEYHTSLDDFNLVKLKGVQGSFNVSKNAIKILQKKRFPKSTKLCEPNMGKRNLYQTLSTKFDQPTRHLMDFLTYCDGKNSLEKISKFLGINIKKTKQIYSFLIKKNLIS